MDTKNIAIQTCSEEQNKTQDSMSTQRLIDYKPNKQSAEILPFKNESTELNRLQEENALLKEKLEELSFICYDALSLRVPHEYEYDRPWILLRKKLNQVSLFLKGLGKN